jgi:NTP pyrophosphatase (non-canonical NTP hydrolase)
MMATVTSNALDDPALTTLGTFAATQADYLCSRLDIGSLDELAQVNVLKLGEETGEVNGAYLAFLSYQRAEKINGTVEERREALGREIGDVIATAVILAHAVGLDVDATLAARFEEVEDRRVSWLAERDNGGVV